MKDWQQNPEVRKIGLEYAALYENTLLELSFQRPDGGEELRQLGLQAAFYLESARRLGVNVVFKIVDYNEESEEDGTRADDNERDG